jgi:amino acid transporter
MILINNFPGSDAAAHMSEEIKDAGINVPRAMVGSYILNGSLGLVFLISYLFAMTDLDAALNDPTGYPFLTVFAQAVSLPAVNGLTFIVTFLIFCGTLSYNLSTSRQTWAFARDQGLPFSNWIAYVHPKWKVPANSVAVTSGITIVLSFINIGSDVAFNAIISLNLVSLMITYTVSIGCVLHRRIYHPELLPPAKWSLGRAGVAVNTGALLYSSFCFFWCFWPNAVPVNRENFNWAVVMFIAVFFFCLVDWLLRAKNVFKGPVVLVEGWTGSKEGGGSQSKR